MKTTLFVLVLLFGSSAMACSIPLSDDLKLEIQGKITDSEGLALNAVTVSMIQANDTVQHLTTSNGKFSLSITPNKDKVFITFSLKGHIIKSILFDFTSNLDEWENEIMKTELSLSLIKKRKDVDYSKVETDFYLGRYYISEYGTLEIDTPHMAKQKFILDQFLLLHHKD